MKGSDIQWSGGSLLSTLSTTPPGHFSFTNSGTTLTWTAVPEPTSALAGLLLGAGLLRRRRKPVETSGLACPTFTPEGEMPCSVHTQRFSTPPIPDCRMNGGSLRYWESQYDIMATPNMMSSPHGWSAWRLYGLWYLYQLTGEKEYLRQAMNGLGSCVQLMDFKTGDLRWGFVTDPCVHARVFEKNPSGAPMGIFADRVIGEQYLPMISDWYRAQPNTFVNGYLAMDAAGSDARHRPVQQFQSGVYRLFRSGVLLH